MTDGAHLPEDLRLWPRDPSAVLGIARAAGQREVRRAYARLIRQFRPDRCPEHFQRIRSAYEALMGGALISRPVSPDKPPAAPVGRARGNQEAERAPAGKQAGARQAETPAGSRDNGEKSRGTPASATAHEDSIQRRYERLLLLQPPRAR